MLSIFRAYTVAKWKKYLYLQIRKVVKKTKWNLSFWTWAGLIYQLHNYFQLVYMRSKLWWNFSSFCHDQISTVIAILLLHCFHLSCQKKSYDGLTSWNFSQGRNSESHRIIVNFMNQVWFICMFIISFVISRKKKSYLKNLVR